MRGLVTLPLRLGMSAARLAIRSAAAALRHLTDGGEQQEPERPAARPQARAAAPPPAASPAPPHPEPEARVEQPPRPEPLVPEEHVSEEPELVADSADPDATETPGPEVSVDEPWPRYRRAKAAEVIASLPDRSREELAVAQLYESTHRRRSTVLEAMERQLKVSSPPRSS